MPLREAQEPEEPEEEEPNFAQFYRPHEPVSERSQSAKPLITSDTDNETKSRVTQAFVMTMVDCLEVWAEIEGPPPFKCPQCQKNRSGGLVEFFSREAYLQHRFGERMRINWISEGGKSRDEYVEALQGPSVHFGEGKEQARLREGRK